MPKYAFVTVDVFTDRRFGGNPLAVFPDGRGLSDADMQALAAEFNLSETTFVLPPEDPANTARVRIFTPKSELPFAGHPNVGTGWVLAQEGRDRDGVLRFEEIAGLVAVRLVRNGTAVVGGRIRAPRELEIGRRIDRDTAAACASLPAAEVATGAHEPVMVSVGLPFALVELASLEALGRARPNVAAFAAADDRYRHPDDRFSLFLYHRAAGGLRIRARMFAPLSNTFEDPATGSASAALGAYLVSLDTRPNVSAAFTVEQGVEMGRRGLIEVEASKADGVVSDVWIQGRCVPAMRGVLEL